MVTSLFSDWRMLTSHIVFPFLTLVRVINGLFFQYCMKKDEIALSGFVISVMKYVHFSVGAMFSVPNEAYSHPLLLVQLTMGVFLEIVWYLLKETSLCRIDGLEK